LAGVVWTEKALAWLEEIHGYIAEENPGAVVGLVDAISGRVDQLEMHPQSGHRYEQSARHIRILVYRSYRIAYLVESERRVFVLGVFHGAMDITRFLD
jgi:plasmid stabilization system protein ParE